MTTMMMKYSALHRCDVYRYVIVCVELFLICGSGVECLVVCVYWYRNRRYQTPAVKSAVYRRQKVPEEDTTVRTRRTRELWYVRVMQVQLRWLSYPVAR